MSEPRYYFELEQGSTEWLEARLGIVTASELNTLITPKGKPAKGAKVRMYAAQKAAERVTRFLEDNYQSFDMARGSFEEVLARDIYNDNYQPVTECGFITREIFGVTAGASPDGLIGELSGCEIKCRKSKFQVETILLDEVPDEYLNQIQGTMLISGRKSWEFISYSSGLPLYVKTVYPDLERQAVISNAIVEIESMIVEMVEGYKARASTMVQTERVEFVYGDDVIIESGE